VRIEVRVAAKKHLVVCLDGTWSNADSTAPQTNVAILASIIDPDPEGAAEQRVYYDAGVGTDGYIDGIFGGAFGKGLTANVLAAYRFLSQFYRPDDNIYVFGYSRGAFTARSLCGFISASGLLTEDMCNEANLLFAWRYYRTPPKARYPADRARLRRLTHNPDPRVRFLGVFDTVGALGIPKSLMRVGRPAIEFHDTEVSSAVIHSCQALAIDEHRVQFEPAIWVEPRHRKYETVEQVWFPGSHCDIGGGGVNTALSDIVLGWMLTRLINRCPEMKLKPFGVWGASLQERFGSRFPNFMGKITDPRSWLFWRSRRRPLLRVINGCEPEKPWPGRLTKLRPHARPIGEKLHHTARDRYDKTVRDRRRKSRYEPPNLIAALSTTPIVGPDGEVISNTEAANSEQARRETAAPMPSGDGRRPDNAPRVISGAIPPARAH
jgi:hypothetical protein